MNHRVSHAQMERMIEFMEEYPQLAKGQMRSTLGRYETTLLWEDLSNILNSMDGPKKTTRQWTRFWADKKYGIKRKLVVHREAVAFRQRHSMDGDRPPHLTQLDDRILQLVEDNQSELTTKKEPVVVKQSTNSEVIYCVEAPVVQPKPSNSRAMATKASQTTAAPTSRRSSTTRERRQRRHFIQERERLINIEDRRVKAETLQAAGWRVIARALDHLSVAVVQCGQIVADAMITRHI